MSKNTVTLSAENVEKLNQFIESQKGNQGGLMNVLHEAQEYLGYIPYEAQKIIALGLNVPLSEVYGVVTFYSRFTLTPVGKFKVGVCMGTACYVKGSDAVLAKVEECLGIKAGETSADGQFSIEATRCIGACGLAPVIMINEDVYAKLTANDIPEIIEKYKSGGDKI